MSQVCRRLNTEKANWSLEYFVLRYHSPLVVDGMYLVKAASLSGCFPSFSSTVLHFLVPFVNVVTCNSQKVIGFLYRFMEFMDRSQEDFFVFVCGWLLFSFMFLLSFCSISLNRCYHFCRRLFGFSSLVCLASSSCCVVMCSTWNFKLLFPELGVVTHQFL